MGNRLESNEVDFRVDAEPDRELIMLIETMHHLCDAGVYVRFGFRMYSVQGGLNGVYYLYGLLYTCMYLYSGIVIY